MTKLSVPKQATLLLQQWVERAVPPAALEWVSGKLKEVAKGDRKTFFLAFSLASRKVGKDDLQLEDADWEAAESVRKNWQPIGWTVDQAVRAMFVFTFPSEPRVKYLEALDQLFAAGEVRELIALYQMLPLLPNPEQYTLRAAEGLRTNMKSVFCAVAHNNLYPSEQLTEASWNQMILKCLFIDAALYPVIDIDERVNPSLSRMLCDYAHERWAAGRQVSPELWRCVIPYANESAMTDMKRVLQEGSNLDQIAITFAILSSQNEQASLLLDNNPSLTTEVQNSNLTWSGLHKQYEQK